VDHSAAYQEAIASNHGTQLQLALEEGRGKDDAPFDPFSQFLDQMGTTVDDVDGANNDDGDDVIDGEGIEEAEYKTIEEYDDNQDGEQQLDDDESDDDEEDEGPVYTNTGALYRPKSERLALRAGYPAGGKFAVILLAGKQHKVTHDDLLVVNKLKPVAEWAVGSTHTLKSEDVLLMADKDKTLVGLPGVQGGEVDVMVEEITRDKTLIIFKKRRRKHSRRKNGFRRQVTFLRVLDVRMPGEEAKGAEGNDIDAGMEGMSMAA
jgi:large subunit ribosomal protein L21